MAFDLFVGMDFLIRLIWILITSILLLAATLLMTCAAGFLLYTVVRKMRRVLQRGRPHRVR